MTVTRTGPADALAVCPPEPVAQTVIPAPMPRTASTTAATSAQVRDRAAGLLRPYRPAAAAADVRANRSGDGATGTARRSSGSTRSSRAVSDRNSSCSAAQAGHVAEVLLDLASLHRVQGPEHVGAQGHLDVGTGHVVTPRSISASFSARSA